jgi:hypothetical protein
MKELVEDGYLEHRFGREGVWRRRNLLSSYYIGTQFDSIGSCFVKGGVFVIVFVISYLVILNYNK